MGQKLGQDTAGISCLCSTMSWDSAEKTQIARASSGGLFTHLSDTQAGVIRSLGSEGSQNTFTGPLHVAWASSEHGSLRDQANQAEALWALLTHHVVR